MTIYDFGTILLVNFPQTDFKKGPKRPALVIYDEGDEDVILARITSQPHAGKNDYEIPNWQQAGLLVPSSVRVGKLATIKKTFIQHVIGKLAQNECTAIKNILQDMFKP